MDNLYTGRLTNLSECQRFSTFKFIEQDICDPFEWTGEGIYHLACPASPVHYQATPIKTLKTNFIGTLNVLEAAQRCGATVLLTSTSEVYGDPKEHPQTETYRGHVNPVGPRSCYDEGKRVAETLCYEFHQQHSTSIRIARLFNTYGPNMNARDGRIISNFIVQALQEMPLTVYGDGSQTRSLCYVDDTVEALMRLYESSCTTPVNIGNNKEFTVSSLAEKVCHLIGSEVQLSFHSLPQDDPLQRCPDLQKAKALLGWSPKVTLDEGLQKTIEYFQNELTQVPIQ
jgi:UDP-glucuronate decarboxylase